MLYCLPCVMKLIMYMKLCRPHSPVVTIHKQIGNNKCSMLYSYIRTTIYCSVEMNSCFLYCCCSAHLQKRHGLKGSSMVFLICQVSVSKFLIQLSWLGISRSQLRTFTVIFPSISVSQSESKPAQRHMLLAEKCYVFDVFFWSRYV